MSLATTLDTRADRAASETLAQKTDRLSQDFATRAERHDADGSFVAENYARLNEVPSSVATHTLWERWRPGCAQPDWP